MLQQVLTFINNVIITIIIIIPITINIIITTITIMINIITITITTIIIIIICSGLNVCVPPKSYAEALIPKVLVFVGEIFRR